jgi:hypothetical protein
VIETLATLTPDAARGAKTMARCHGRLAARRRQVEAREKSRNLAPSPGILAAERLLLTGACVIYLIAMAGNVLRAIG